MKERLYTVFYTDKYGNENDLYFYSRYRANSKNNIEDAKKAIHKKYGYIDIEISSIILENEFYR